MNAISSMRPAFLNESSTLSISPFWGEGRGRMMLQQRLVSVIQTLVGVPRPALHFVPRFGGQSYRRLITAYPPP